MSVPTDGAATPHAWEQLWRWWVAILAAAGLLVAIVVAVDSSLPPLGRLAGVSLVVALGVGYWKVGLAAARGGDDRRSAAYIVAVILAEAALLALHPAGFLLLFGLYPQCYTIFRRFRWGALSAMALTALTAVASLGWAGWRRDAIPAVVVQTAFTGACGLFFGVWISRIIGQSGERAALIEELQRTRDDLAAANRLAGMHEERERLATEIHDTLAQGFTSIVLLAQAARADDARRDDHLSAIEATARENLAEARSLVADLGPTALHGATLAAAIERVAASFAAQTGVELDVRVTGEQRALPPAHEVALLRATQEALANVRKHAAASRVWVELGYGPEVRLRVRDDGRGFDPAAAHGFGLAGLRRRIAQEGGGVRVCSAAGAGTTIEVELP